MYQSERPYFAIAARLTAAFFVGTLMMLVKLADHEGIAIPEIMFWRQVLTIPVVLVLLGSTGQLGLLQSNRLKSHAFRATLSLVGMGSTFAAAILLTLPQASVLTFTTPLFAVLISTLFLGEGAGPWRWSAVLMGFGGVLVMAQPGGDHFPLLGALAGLTAALVIVIISYQLKDLARTDAPIACVFYLAVFSSLVLAMTLPFFATAHTPEQWLLLLGIGLCGLVAQFLLTVSLKYGAVATVLIMDYTLLLWATLFGWLVWDRLPHVMTWLGAPLIIGAGIIITWREHRLAREASPISANELD